MAMEMFHNTDSHNGSIKSSIIRSLWQRMKIALFFKDFDTKLCNYDFYFYLNNGLITSSSKKKIQESEEILHQSTHLYCSNALKTSLAFPASYQTPSLLWPQFLQHIRFLPQLLWCNNKLSQSLCLPKRNIFFHEVCVCLTYLHVVSR